MHMTPISGYIPMMYCQMEPLIVYGHRNKQKDLEVMLEPIMSYTILSGPYCITVNLNLITIIIIITAGPGSKERWDFRPSAGDVADVKSMFKDDLEVPYNFEQTALAFKDTGERLNMRNVPKPQATTNSQTTEFCSQLGIHDPMALLLGNGGSAYHPKNNSYYYYNSSDTQPQKKTPDANEIDLSEICDDEDSTFQDSKLESTDTSSIQPSPIVKSISIPEPKVDNDQGKFLEVIESMAANNETKTEETNSLFMIDTQGDDVKPVHESPVEEVKPVKKLKRRNAAMYATE